MSRVPYTRRKEKKPEYEEPEPIVMRDVPAEIPVTVEAEATQSKVIAPDDVMGPHVLLRIEQYEGGDKPIISGQPLDIDYTTPTLQILDERYKEAEPIHGPANVPARPEDLLEPVKPEIAKPHLGEGVESPPGSWLYGHLPEKKEKEK